VSSTAQVIRKAADHIEKVGLFKEYYFEDTDNWQETPCCTYGALRVANGTFYADALVELAAQQIIDTLGLRVIDGIAAIPAWNDHPDQTASGVVESLRKVADKLEARDG
jgi:hypothetical protein